MRAGLLAEFEKPEQMLEVLRHLRSQGYRGIDAFTPWPVKGLDEALDLPRSPVSKVVLVAGLTGATLAYLIQWGVNAVDYPLIVGARPPNAVPAFIPIIFETAVLFAGFAALFSCFYFSGLPKLWDPMFEVEGFESATIDRFWVGIDSEDQIFNASRLERELTQLGAMRVVAFGERRET